MNALIDTLAQWRDALFDYLPVRGIGKTLLTVLILYFLIAGVVGMYWSIAPPAFDVREKSQELLAQHGGTPVTGTATMGTLIAVTETLLDKRGGFLHNDRLPPGVWLDNIPNWEYGVLIQVRDLSRAMREVLSRSQSQSTEDPGSGDCRTEF